MQINEKHGTYNRSKRNTAIKYIVIHYTGGTGSAENNCIYFGNGNRNASADYFIDDSGIWEYNDPSEGYYSWHCGGGTRYNDCTNSNSIGVESVSNGSDFTETEIGYLAELVRHLMSTYGIDADHVCRHYDCNHKQCPYPYIDESKWSELKARITAATASATTTSTASSATTSTASSTAANLDVDGYWGNATTSACQTALGTTVDGIVSNQLSTYKSSNPGLMSSSWQWQSSKNGGSQMVKAIQQKVGSSADGYIGPNTIKALQSYLGTTIDGKISKPSQCVKELQRRLNAGTF